jgi:hypothetical protein
MNPARPLALRPKAAARMLSISERYLWQLTDDGQIPCRRVGNGKRKTVLYSMAALEAWLGNGGEERQPGANEEPRHTKGFSDAK